MEQLRLDPMTYRNLRARNEYILLRENPENPARFVVNHMRIDTDPCFDVAAGETVLWATGLRVQQRQLDPESIRLTVDEIGCPRKGSPAGIRCRTYRYEPQLYEMLVQLVVNGGRDIIEVVFASGYVGSTLTVSTRPSLKPPRYSRALTELFGR
jgi:hypothetical protein